MITTTGEYALRAAVFLAGHHPDAQTSIMISSATQIPCGYLSKVLQPMVHSELVLSQRGLHGGFALAHDPHEITVRQVLISVDSMPQRMRRRPVETAQDMTLSRLHSLLDEAIALVEVLFENAHLSDLVSSPPSITSTDSSS